MKFLYLTLLALMIAVAGFAQCNPSFTCNTLPPVNNYLLRVSIENTTSFTGTPGGTSATYTVNFGDGGSTEDFYITSGQEHTYSTPGTYTITVTMSVYDTATNTITCTNSVSQPVTVSYTTCATALNYSTSFFDSSEIFNFTAITPVGSTGMTYSWDFGDGMTGTGATTTHAYTNGIYEVTLTATSQSGCTYANTTYLVVTILNCSALNTDFTSTTSTNNSVANFYPESDTSVGIQVPNQTWNYGDGTTRYNASHTYTAGGIYNVTLTTMWITSDPVDTCVHSITHSVTVGDPAPPPSIILGNLNFDPNILLDSNNIYKVWLIKFDSSANLLSAIDSQMAITSYGDIFLNYEFYNVPTGQYRIKGQVIYTIPTAYGLIPTYDSSSLYWNTASIINHQNNTITNADIYMQMGIPTSGPGFIGGDVTQGANKGTATDGVMGLNIFLRDSSNNIISYAVTDANGNYSFSNLANGTYSIYPEALNYTTTPYNTITLNSGNETASGISFKQQTASKTITPVTTAVANLNKGQDISIYPNPTNGIINIEWKNSNLNTAHIIVSDAVGRKVSESIINMNTNSNSGIQSISLSNLKDGIYFISITADNYNKTQKLVIQH